MPITAPAAITTARLLLRPLEISDLPALREVNAVDEVTRYLPYDSWRAADDAQAWFDRMARLQDSASAIQLVIADQASNIPIGTFLVFNMEAASARAEIGYVLGRAHWGKGYMRETLTAMLDWLFDTQGQRRIEATIDPRNGRSARLLEAHGFRQEGLQRERWLTKGELQDGALYALLKRERPAR